MLQLRFKQNYVRGELKTLSQSQNNFALGNKTALVVSKENDMLTFVSRPY